MFFYNDSGKGEKGYLPPYHKQNASKYYLNHYRNWMFLRFILYNTRSTPAEKRQANKEMVICDRKLEHWKKHVNFDMKVVEEGKCEINRQWRQ